MSFRDAALKTGRTICEECEYGISRAKFYDEEFDPGAPSPMAFSAGQALFPMVGRNIISKPVWYVLSELLERATMPEDPRQELMDLVQMLHDLDIMNSGELMNKLGAVYVEDDSKPGEYHYAGFDRLHSPKEAKKPRMSNRRQAIMAQKEKKNEGS